MQELRGDLRDLGEGGSLMAAILIWTCDTCGKKLDDEGIPINCPAAKVIIAQEGKFDCLNCIVNRRRDFVREVYGEDES